MNYMNQTKKMYTSRMMVAENGIGNMVNSKFAEEIGLVEKMRDVKNIEEYKYLLTVSQREFKPSYSNSYWIEGYPLGICPIRSKENINLIEWSLENGDFFSHPFALGDTVNRNYEKLLSILGVYSVEGRVPTDILVKKCGLLVTMEMTGGEFAYYLHDICTMEELTQHRKKMGLSTNLDRKEVFKNVSK